MLERGNGIHHAEHGGNRRFVANRTRGIWEDEPVRDDTHRMSKRNKGRYDREQPEDNLRATRERQQANDGEHRGDHHHIGHELDDDGLVRRIGELREQVGARRIVMGDNDHRAVARRRERAGRLVIGDDVLGEAGCAEARKRQLSHTLQHVHHTHGDREQEADDAHHAANTHEHRAHKERDTQRGEHNLRGARGVELLNLRLKAMVGEDAGDVFCSGSLFLAARGSDPCVLE